MRSTLDPRLDVVFKMLFAARGHEEVLVALLTAVLRPKVPIEHIEVLNPDIPKEGIDDKGSILDIRVRLADGTQLDVEMQVAGRKGFRKRALYYWSRLFGTELAAGQPYTDLRPVISVLFLAYVELPGPRLHSTFRIREIHDHSELTDALEMHFIELPKLRQEGDTLRRDEPELVAWSRFLAAESDAEVEEVCMSNPAIKKANELLEGLSRDPPAQELARQRELALHTYWIEMGAARQEGREEGRQEGREIELRSTILALAPAFGLELDDARRQAVDAMSLDELVDLRDRLIRDRHW